MQPSSSSTLARAVFAFVGIGAMATAISNVTSGQSLSDPVMPGGIVLGAFMLGAAVWVGERGFRAIVVWLGIAALVVALAIIAWIALQTPRADVIALVAIPSLLLLAAAIRLAKAQVDAAAETRSR